MHSALTHIQRVLSAILCVFALLSIALNGFAAQNFATSTAGLSKENEYQIGQNWLRQLRAANQEWHQPLIREYIYQMVRRLGVNQIDEQAQLTVIIIDSKQFNAFATIGGVIGVTRGLLESVENEAQLLAVMAHELAHLKQRHVVRAIEEQKQLQLMNFVSVLSGILLAAAGEGEAGSALFYGGQAQTIGTALKWSRAKETEADQVGSDILTAAGHSPKAMLEAQQLMAKLFDHTEHPLEGYLSTHPLALNRMSTATNENLGMPAIRADSENFKIMKAMISLDKNQKEQKIKDIKFNAMSQMNLTEAQCEYMDKHCLAQLRTLALSFPSHLPSQMLIATKYLASGLNSDALSVLSNTAAHSKRYPDYWQIRAIAESRLHLEQQSRFSKAKYLWLSGSHESAISVLVALDNDFGKDLLPEIKKQTERWKHIIETYQ